MTEKHYGRFTITNNILSNASVNKIHGKWLKHSKHHALSSNDKNEFAKPGKLLYFLSENVSLCFQVPVPAV